MMMKKFLALLLVLGMASAASATLQISVNGEPAPPDTQIYLAPSETIEIDVYTDAVIANYTGFTWGLVTVDSDGSISNMTAIDLGGTHTNQINGPWPDDTNPTLVDPPAGTAGVWATSFAIGADIPADTVLAVGIFHCEWQPNDALIGLFLVPETGTVTWEDAIDTVTIHQIPEPMTVALLGLGGLFLLRRRR
jgi:hypothetical protein